ncbi:hypothetical protein MHZ92_00695 [Sporosarcina sp. ACRSL]|uniref:hypothetical protein n=1 Tax=Sporosarcina sp. ACRSL TaxID=2918215 RepID=UPI001EF44D11|nr:hypothetical protein [Sporosarcina sp. ACRSL]MCG7342627.1 hypothetical protein [Sporosarcina sp. ACRSL]
MNIRKLDKSKENDLSIVTNFTDKVFSENSDLKTEICRSIFSKLHKDIIMVCNEKEILVLASTHKSYWHPHCIYVRLAYNLDAVDEQALQSIISELKSTYDQPLFFLLDDRFNQLKEMLARNKFKMIRKTAIIHIDPTQSVGKTERDERILSIRQIRDNKARMDCFVQLCKKTYTETHTDNPVANLPIESWKDAALDGLMDEHSYVIVDGLEITAFSLLYESDEKSWELGWIGVNDLARITDLDRLIHRQIEDAVKQGISFIEKEVDSTCPYSLHICESLKYEVAETLYAYLK